ncbi:MAG TPA: MotA/TolQ/ExbB proton channel family protein [Longimicrobiales bacterium]|nr:MotA/TolQ/ExbB proton channel family protein [Longimicrobiales bacterium]
MSGFTFLNLAMLQLPGQSAPDLSPMEWLAQMWNDGGWMMWFLGTAFVVGVVIIIWKLIDLGMTSTRTKQVLHDVDERLAAHDVQGAMVAARESDTPAGRILLAGLERHGEGSERVMKAIENVGLIQMASLEKGLVWLATITNIAPLLGFLGTVIGMIVAFQNIEAAGEVEATLVAGGIKIALITTATGLIIAIPMSIMHNYFVSKVDRMVIDMEESAQRLIDTLQEIGGDKVRA